MPEQQDLTATEIKENAVAVAEAPTFDLPVLVSPEEAAMVVQENLQGLDGVRFDKIKIPSGGGISFEVPDENGEATPVKKLEGVILHKKPFRAWYIKSFDEKTDEDTGVPDCWSEDMVHGSGCEAAGIPVGQKCADCPKGQWGSDRRGGKGKDCPKKMRLHTLMEGSVFPVVLDLPPTSLGNFTDYIKRLANKLNPFYGVVTSIGLEKEKSGSGIEYSKATFGKAAGLNAQERSAIKKYIETLRPQMEQISRESIGEVDAVEVGGTEAATGADGAGDGAQLY